MPSITDVFGANAQVLSTETTITGSVSDPVLLIRASDLTTWNDRTQISNPNKWLAAIMRKVQDYFAVADRLQDGSLAVTAAPTYLSLADRTVDGNTVTKVWYQTGVNFYVPFIQPTLVDPDDVA